MVNTEKLKETLTHIIHKPVNTKTNEFLKSIINYDSNTKFAAANVLIDKIPQDEDGIFCRGILISIVNYLSRQDTDLVLASALKQSGQKYDISKLLNQTVTDTNKKRQKVRTVYSKSKFNIAGIEVQRFLDYDINTKEVVEHIYQVGVDTTNVFG